MKLIYKCDIQKFPSKGYALYDIDFYRKQRSYCRWWIYPIFKVKQKLHYIKVSIYRELNSRGIMNTPEGCVMRLSDLWKKEVNNGV